MWNKRRIYDCCPGTILNFTCHSFVRIFTALYYSVLDARLQARLRIASRMVTVLFSIHQSLLLPRDTTPRVNLEFYLPTPSGRHHRCPQTSLGLHGLSSHQRQILPRCIPHITLCNHSHSSRRARDRRLSLQIHKSRVHSHYGQATPSTGITSSRVVRFLGL
jgi:hypothetical protein